MCEDPSSVAEVTLDHSGGNGAHDRYAEPSVMKGGEGVDFPVSIHEAFECDLRNEAGLDPLIREHGIHWNRSMTGSESTLTRDTRTEVAKRGRILGEQQVIYV